MSSNIDRNNDASGAPFNLRGVPVDMRDAVFKRSVIIAVIAFLTLIDLFGSQALLPLLVDYYQVSPATMGFAVNASTIGMAIAGLTVALFADRIDRKLCIWLSLALLAVPTFLLTYAQDTTTFAMLRIVQGFFMSAAFTLTLTYLSEVCTITAASGAMAAYITGNVASNLFGRLLASTAASQVGLAESFYIFAALNFAGAVIAFFYFGARSKPSEQTQADKASVVEVWKDHLSNVKLRSSFAIGFIILFAFVGTFTYVNFILVGEPFNLPQAYIGFVYFVFLPSMITTPIASKAVAKYGTRPVFWASAVVSLIAVLALLSSSLTLVLAALAVIGASLFFAQAAATSYVGRTASHHKAVANGLYLTSYYVGGLAGAAFLGQIFVTLGWPGTVGFIALSIVAAIGLGTAMRD